MKSIQVKILPATETKPTRLKVCTDENKGFTVSINSCAYFPENIASGETVDQAEYMANDFLRNHLKWDNDNKYRLVGGTFNGVYFFNMVFNSK